MGSTIYSSTNNILLLIFLSTLFIHLTLAAKPSSSSARCIESDWEALKEFKAGLLDGSTRLSSWTGRDCCSWHGITCHNSTGRVQKLDLAYYSPIKSSPPYSPLSPWLFNLSSLEFLTIYECGLGGPIPNMFEKFPSLIHLNLSRNLFSCPLPTSLCSLTSLSELYIVSCELKGLLPPCLGNMTSLTKLDFGDNDLSGKIPSELGNLTHLTYLSFSTNYLHSSIPSSLGHLSKMEYLCLTANQLSSTIPSSLGNLTKLTQLFLNINSLTGELSESFFEGLNLLETLYLSENKHIVLKLSSQWIPPFQIQIMGMDSVFIGTEFPFWLQTQRNLDTLIMKNASIYGAIPDWYLTGFPNLTFIDLSSNFLTGSVPNQSLPDKFSSMTHLIDLSSNSLSGIIPQNLCNLTSLTTLSLGNNQLTGTIPSCLRCPRNLTILNLGDNNLSGHIPDELGSISHLVILHLNGNKLSGKVPKSLQNLARLRTLDLGKNELHGSMPPRIGMNWSRLRYLILESNNISGPIPLNLCQCSSLQILNLALNNLVGTIPPCFGNLSMMSSGSIPDVGSYYFTDAIVNYIKGAEMKFTSSLQYAKFISLSGNHLHREIPAELMNLKGLQSLNLSNNEFTGMIPQTINNLTHLESLDLSSNQLSGNIPQSLADIDALEYLNLSINNFVGRIPSGNHFDTLFNPSIYQGNKELCGKPLTKSCPGDDSDQPKGPDSDDGGDDDFDWLSWMYAGVGPGFAVGFLGVIFILYFKGEWRTAYFAFADNVYYKVRLTPIVVISQFRTSM